MDLLLLTYWPTSNFSANSHDIFNRVVTCSGFGLALRMTGLTWPQSNTDKVYLYNIYKFNRVTKHFHCQIDNISEIV